MIKHFDDQMLLKFHSLADLLTIMILVIIFLVMVTIISADDQQPIEGRMITLSPW